MTNESTAPLRKLLMQYATYNRWANDQCLRTAAALTEDQRQMPTPASQESVWTTLQHLLYAEGLWWQRMKLVESPVHTKPENFSALQKALLQSGKEWIELAEKSQPHLFEHVYHFQLTKRSLQKITIAETMLQVFDQATYQRGQLNMAFQALGVKKLPVLSFAEWRGRGGSTN